MRTTNTPYCPLLAAAALATAVATGAAQSTTFPLDPRATFLRYDYSQDFPMPPVVVPLATLGAAPGQWLRIESSGAFSMNGNVDTQRRLLAVFSANDQWLPGYYHPRVLGARPAGPGVNTGLTYFGGLDTDIAEDFLASLTGHASQVLVPVPAGATHLFLGTFDSHYADNSDPNGDWAAIVTVVPTPPLPGTGENIELRVGVGVPAAALPSSHVALPGAAIVIETRCPIDRIAGSLWMLAVDLPLASAPVVAPFPQVWLSYSPVLLDGGVWPTTVGTVANRTITVPAGFQGFALVLQAGAFAPTSRNGGYQTTIAHRVLLQ
jgi:hypothetical protein